MAAAESKRPLRVLHILGAFGTGGTEQGIINLLNHTDPARVEAGVCAFVRDGSEESLARIRRKGTFFRCLDKRFGNDPRVPLRLARAVKEGGFDLVHSHGWPTYLETRAALALCRRVSAIHGEHGTSFLEAGRRRWAFGAFSGRFRRFLFVSDRLRRQFQEQTRIDPGKMQVIVNGVDFQRFSPDGPGLREEGSCFSPGLFHVGTVGRFHPVKNHRLLLDLARLAVERDFPLRVHFAGDGPLFQEYRDSVRACGAENAVCFHGSIREVERFYRSLDLFVLTSKSEGHPNAVLEAMASGTPVASTPVGDLPGFLRNGENGYLYETAEELFALTRQASGSPAALAELAARGRAEARARFALPVMTEAYAQVYESVLRTLSM